MDQSDYIVDQYVNHSRGTSSIGKELNVNPRMIREVLLRRGIKIRTSSESMKLFRKTNPPVNKGKILSDEEKQRITQGLWSYHDNLSGKDKEAFRERGRAAAVKHWGALTEEEREKKLHKMRQGSNAVAGWGSRAEKLLGEALVAAGIPILRRCTSIIPPYEVDIFLEKHSTCIEIDGPSHFLSTYGEDDLRRREAKDEEKNSYCLGRGLTMIRCLTSSNPSKRKCSNALKEILSILNRENKKPTVFNVNIGDVKGIFQA